MEMVLLHRNIVNKSYQSDSWLLLIDLSQIFESNVKQET